ncbi:MAG: hypothetical protein HY816_18945 [Candidatus Wallbacteria bacterium]|nr:hypothetical protein [Candidatus Wallbacteria bacterium]
MTRALLFAALFLATAGSAWADVPPPPPPPPHGGPLHAVGSLLGLLQIFLLVGAAGIGLTAFTILAQAADSTRGELETLADIADHSPRKSLAIGVATAAFAFFFGLAMMHAPPLKLFGLALIVMLLFGILKGLISRVAATGRLVARRFESVQRFPFHEAVLGALLFAMAFMFPLLGQVFVLLAALQGLGAYTLHLLGRATPAAPLPAPAE